jgi:hypothetical protein
MKVIKVPQTPNREMYRKYLKNDLLLRLYPAANIIGGKMKVKNIPLSNLRE